MEERYKKLFQLITAGSGIVFIVFLLAAGIQESRPEWLKYQRRFKSILVEKSENETQAAAAKKMKPQIRQIILEDVDRIDRCPTCHLGINDVRMKGQPIPYRVHSGEHLTHHDVSEYGCTLCHEGQGQAVDAQNAHARSEDVDWPYPLRSLDHVESSCGQCHLAIFEDPESFPGTEVFQKGLILFRQEGCLGCHKTRGVGGTLGPDLTEQGRKTSRDYNFAYITGERTAVNWLHEHFEDPEMVSPGSQMLALNLVETDIQALITFTLGMTRPDIPFDYFALETLQEFKGQRQTLTGSEVFPMLCSACHGKSGEGKSYKEYKTGIPAIGSSDFLSVASKDFIAFSIYHGRSGQQMEAWLPRFSGLKPEEILALTDFVKSRRPIHSEFETVRAAEGRAERGKILYNDNCAMCHGSDGKGAEVITINNRDLLSAASDEYLYKTIVNGRGNTAMPGWGHFTSKDTADILAFLKSWQDAPERRGSFAAAEGDVTRGEEKYHYLCSRCHGIYGQGDTGPSIINVDFLDAASDFFLAEMIAKGRQGTAMLGWSTAVSKQVQLSAKDIADVIAFLRHSAANPPDVIYPGPSFGSAEQGNILFQRLCVECHGKNGEGSLAPALNNQELLNAATNGFLYATISRGRAGTEMPSWGRRSDKFPRLSSEERHDVTAFLRAWQRVVIKKRLNIN